MLHQKCYKTINRLSLAPPLGLDYIVTIDPQ